MEKKCRQLTKVYVYRKRSGREAMHLNLFSGGIVIKQLKNNRKQIQMATLPWVESTEMPSLRFVEYSIENPETGID